jgi:hypothetical protein
MIGRLSGADFGQTGAIDDRAAPTDRTVGKEHTCVFYRDGHRRRTDCGMQIMS